MHRVKLLAFVQLLLLTVASAHSYAQQIPSSDNDYAKVNVFGVEGTGNKFIYVFDRSGSMEGAPLAAAKSQLLKSLETLDDLRQFHIIFYSHRLLSFDLSGARGRIAFGTDQNKRAAARFVASVKADGGTDRFLALKTALALQPDTIFFLSDADDPMRNRELNEILRINERTGAKICVIEFGTGKEPHDNFLKLLARESGGNYKFIDIAKLPR